MTSSQAIVGQTNLASLSDRVRTFLRRDRLGFVFQSCDLLPTLSAEENITLPSTWTAETSTGIDPAGLCAGLQQRVAVGRASHAVLTWSSPTSPPGAMDSKASAELLRLLRSTVDDLGRRSSW